MTFEDFDKLVENRVTTCVDLMVSKSAEYSRGEDKLHNFKVAGRIDNISPERALRGMDLKHRTSIADIVDDIDKGKLPSREKLSEKMNDSINYLLLLEALIVERMGEPEKQRRFVRLKATVAPDCTVSVGVENMLDEGEYTSESEPVELVGEAKARAHVRGHEPIGKAINIGLKSDIGPFLYGLGEFHALGLPNKLERIKSYYLSEFGKDIDQDAAVEILIAWENIGA